MISTLIAVCDHVHYKAFDHVNISKIYAESSEKKKFKNNHYSRSLLDPEN